MENANQRSLFEGFDAVAQPGFSGIPGLKYIQDFIDNAQHDDLLQQIDALPWLTELKRRVQHYGFKYDYKSRSVDHSMRIGTLPAWADELADLFCERRLAPGAKPDQLL